MDKIVDHLYLGDIRAAQDFDKLQQHGITHIVILASNLSPMFPDDFTYHKVAVQDEHNENIAKHIHPFISFVNNAIKKEKGTVLVHCMTGGNLTLSYCAAYLIKEH